VWVEDADRVRIGSRLERGIAALVVLHQMWARLKTPHGRLPGTELPEDVSPSDVLVEVEAVLAARYR
jgi:hypothetical protein